MRADSIPTSPPRCAIVGLIVLAMLLPACSTAPKAPDSGRSSRPAGSQAAPRNGQSDAEIGASAAQHALAMRGKPYRYGGYSPNGFDCSGLVHYSYSRAGGQLPRNTNGLWSRSRAISMSDVRPGDLLFFDQEGKKNSHVGIYLGNRRFVHAPSSGKQVSTASLSDPYWRDHLSGVRRPVL
jgi:murein DD-endopeptidase